MFASHVEPDRSQPSFARSQMETDTESGPKPWPLTRLPGDPTEMFEIFIYFTPARRTFGTVIRSGLEVCSVVESERINTGQAEFIDLSPYSASTIWTKSPRINPPRICSYFEYFWFTFDYGNSFYRNSIRRKICRSTYCLAVRAITK